MNKKEVRVVIKYRHKMRMTLLLPKEIYKDMVNILSEYSP